MKKPTRLFLALSAAASMLCATETRIWSQGDRADFEKGDRKKLSLSSEGSIRLAPAFQEVLDSSSVYLWALAEDSKGNLYAGGGGPGGPGARVYLIPPNGSGKTLAQLDDLEIHAIAVDRQDRVYVATAPDGKVYRLSPAGKPVVFFDPKAKYIWGMAFDSHGNLFLATGDRGEIYRITPGGEGKLFYKTSETHARSLAIDPNDNLVVGTEPDGLIVRVSPQGEGFVLYQAAKREITAVAVASDGSIYAAGVGNKTPSTGPGFLPGAPAGHGGTPPAAVAPQQPPAPPMPGMQTSQRPAAAPSTAPAVPVAPVAGGSEVYRIDKDGFPHRIWSDAQSIAYAIGFDAERRPLVGTGNKGAIYRIDSPLVYTELLNAPPTQVTAVCGGPNGKIFAATGNVGKVYQMGPGLEKRGTIESDVFDAGMYSYWGRLTFRGAANGGRIAVETRSGNLDRPQNDWSAWSAAITSPDGARVTSPPARFLEWRAVLEASATGDSPELHSVDVAYLPKNVAPEVEQIEITPDNYRFPAQVQLTLSANPPLNLPPIGKPARTPMPSSLADSAVSLQYAKGYIGARWTASDDNGDELIYTVQIRGENEKEWKPLKDKLTERHLSWDSTAFPDGEYLIRVTASDSPGNPPEQALTGELVSDAFTIDNTPPAIAGLAATAAANKITVRWHAADALSTIDHAEYSVDGGDWTIVEPTTKLSDSKEEDYVLTLDRPAPGERTIAVRVVDERDNTAVAKVVVK